MTTVAPRPDAPTGIVVHLDVSRVGRYISFECQLGAHWGCPGGLQGEAGAPPLLCMCGYASCSCARNLPTGER